jgi:hypothetical protein
MQHLLVHLPWEAKVRGPTQFRWMYSQERELKKLRVPSAHTTRYHILEEVPLSGLSIFQWKGKCVGAPSAHYVMEDEWNYIVLYMYTNMEEVQPYFELFDKTYWK